MANRHIIRTGEEHWGHLLIESRGDCSVCAEVGDYTADETVSSGKHVLLKKKEADLQAC